MNREEMRRLYEMETIEIKAFLDDPLPFELAAIRNLKNFPGLFQQQDSISSTCGLTQTDPVQLLPENEQELFSSPGLWSLWDLDLKSAEPYWHGVWLSSGPETAMYLHVKLRGLAPGADPSYEIVSVKSEVGLGAFSNMQEKLLLCVVQHILSFLHYGKEKFPNEQPEKYRELLGMAQDFLCSRHSYFFGCNSGMNKKEAE